MTTTSPQLVLLPPLPTAIAAVTATTAAAVAAVGAKTGAATPLAWASLAATAALTATLATLVWPRLATDLLGLHGTSFPSPADGSDWPLLGRVVKLMVESKRKALVHLCT